MSRFLGVKVRLLVIEDEEFDVRRIRNTLRPFGDQIVIGEVVPAGDRALEILSAAGGRFDVVVMDMQIAGGMKGEPLIRAIKRVAPAVQIIVVTKMTINMTDFDFANRLMEAGAYWYCTKYPADIEEYIYQPTDFILSIFNAYQRKELERAQRRSEKKLLRNVEDILSRSRLLGVSPQIQKLRGQIAQIAGSKATVLISGECGTGKELVAMNIHYMSDRRFENFVPINCGGIPSELVESELFGFEKGSFTGAHGMKRGLFEVADRGTVFLDEIAELSQSAQVKLLRVMQEGEIQKIGRTEKTKVDVRIIAATNKVLQQEMSAGRFRDDLFYRLNVVPLFVPPLRDRPEDIVVLWEHYMREMSVDMVKPAPMTTDETFACLQSYRWPGNVRELKNIVQRLLLNDEQTITPAHVQELLGARSGNARIAAGGFVQFHASEELPPLRELERIVRKKYVEFVRTHSSTDAEAAGKLGLAPSNYHRLSKELGLK